MKEKKNRLDSYWQIIWKQFKKNKIGILSLIVVSLFIVAGVYAPLLASSKPLFIAYEDTWYFPLFRYLFCRGFYSKRLDIFFNILMVTIPLMVFSAILFKKNYRKTIGGILLFHILFFLHYAFRPITDPSSDPHLNKKRHEEIQKSLLERTHADPLLSELPEYPSWESDLQYMTPYARLELILRYKQRKEQNEKLKRYSSIYFKKTRQTIPSLWRVEQEHEINELNKNWVYLKKHKKIYIESKKKLPSLIEIYKPLSNEFLQAKQAFQKKNASPMDKKEFERISQKTLERRKNLRKTRRIIAKYEKTLSDSQYLLSKRKWLKRESRKIRSCIMPLLRPFHWEDDAGGSQSLNKYVNWKELTRINRKDLLAALIFGTRISLVVGILSTLLALSIGVPIGSIAGYYGGKIDILVFRLLEIWESMPTLFMLLLLISILQTKSIFLVITVLGLFSWTGFCRFIRGETLKQRNLPYIDACKTMGFDDKYIIFSHILPNSIPPLLTLLPFSIMGAISSEAGLSFLGLGEEASCSWGALMDEGRSAFPGESYLLWPPGILLTTLLVAIALVGDALRDAFDPKMHR